MLLHIIEALALLSATNGIVFKGGTALRFCFYEDYRYSADLDFSLVGISEAEAVAAIRAALAAAAERIELPHLELVDGPPQEIRFVGPLGRERRIKLDLALDELVVTTQKSPLIIRYPDQADPPPEITTYTLQEIAAEKLRCIIQRLQCRDPFDLHRLIVVDDLDVDAIWELFEQKTRHKGLNPDRFGERLDAREPEYARRWVREISEHTRDVPRFEETMRELRRALRRRG